MIRNARTISAFLMSAALIEGATGAVAATEPAKVVLTPAQKRLARKDVLEKRIAADTEALAALVQEIQTSERLASVKEGTAIVAKVGRAETAREVAARVLGVKDDDNGSRRYKITFGSGFDADTIVIQPSQIVSVIAEGEVAAEAEVVAPVATPEYDSTVEVSRDEYDRPLNAAGQVIGG
jgi:hypothetical protein